jgi:hypothetical protein
LTCGRSASSVPSAPSGGSGSNPSPSVNAARREKREAGSVKPGRGEMDLLAPRFPFFGLPSPFSLLALPFRPRPSPPRPCGEPIPPGRRILRDLTATGKPCI